MHKSYLTKLIKDIPDNADIVISKCFVLDEKKEITGILDIPIVGTAFNKDNNEFRFMLLLKDVDGSFPPKDLKFFKKSKKRSENKKKKTM
jgi:hypothetical protein